MTPGTKLGLILAVAMFVIVGGYFLFVPDERPTGLRDSELPSGETTGGAIDAPELIRADELTGGDLAQSSMQSDDSAMSGAFDANEELDGSTEVTTGGNDLIITWPVRDALDSLAPEIPDREVASFDWDSLTQGLPPSQESLTADRTLVYDAGTPAGPIANEPATIRDGAAIDTYIVKKGDNFWSIARAWYGDGTKMELIAQANPNVNPDRLQIGQRLSMPAGGVGAQANVRATSDVISGGDRPRRTAPVVPPNNALGMHTVREGDTLVRIARQYFNDDSKWQMIFAANRALIGADPDKLKVGTRLTIPR